MMLSFLQVFLQMSAVDSRVHCLDKMATPWMPLGYSCPVNCNNIISAINRLKLIDYETIATPLSSHEQGNSIEQHVDRLSGAKEKIGIKHKLQPTHAKWMEDEAVTIVEHAKNIYRRSGKGNCFKYYKTGNKKGLKKCISMRNGQNVNEIITMVTETLSKYTHSNVTNDITKKLMTKLLGEEELAAGKFALKSVVRFLGHALHAYEDIRKNNMVIQLKSQHCLTTHVPGCFCQAGYVERFGRCISPSECYTDNVYDKYMNRIVVL